MLETLGVLVWKDLIIDWRRKENLVAVFLFSVIILLIFGFSLGENTKALQQWVPGMIWVVFLLSGVLGLSKSFAQELENGCMSALLLTPVDRGLLFISKMLSVTLFLVVTQLFTLPLFLLFFNLPIPPNLGALALVFLGGIVGFASVGTLLSAMTTSLRGKEVLLPLLLFPLIFPLLISAVKITLHLFDGGEAWAPHILSWWKLLGGFDIVLGTAAYLGFEFVVTE